MVYTMTYPVWSGINAEQINSTEINGVAPTPLVITDGFSSAVFPVLMGLHPGLYAEVMRVRPEIRDQRVIAETQEFPVSVEQQNLSVLPEDRDFEAYRSRKRYP